MDCHLNWNAHISFLWSSDPKAALSTQTEALWHRCRNCSIIRYGVSVWYGNLTVQYKTKLVNLVKTLLKVIGTCDIPSLQFMYECSVTRLAYRIINDTSHILYPDFELLFSGRR